jgi:DNA primase
VLGRSLGLADMLWMRETETHPLDTPERRAAFERDLRQTINLLKDEDVRRHYRAEFDNRIAALMPSSARKPAYAPIARGRTTGLRGRARQGLVPLHDAFEPPVRASPFLAQSPLFGVQNRIYPREAFIVLAFLRFPELLRRHVDALAGLDLESAAGRRLVAVLLDLAADSDDLTREMVENRLNSLGLVEDMQNLTEQVRFGDRRCLEQAETAQGGHAIDIAGALHQAMTLHRRAVTLHKELMAAERALAEDDSETSLAIIRDLQLQLSALDGMEAERDRLGGAGLV